MERTNILKLIQAIVSRQGSPGPALEENSDLQHVGFRSLDFAELCLRVEREIGRELNLGAGIIRRIQTVGDVCDLLQEIAAAPAR
jgi:acyl carrier protein